MYDVDEEMGLPSPACLIRMGSVVSAEEPAATVEKLPSIIN
jgi:hypothetical protein